MSSATLDTEQSGRRVVVLGTGTAVGKTHVACALLQLLRSCGQRALGLKPVESGAASVASSETDYAKLAAASADTKAITPAYLLDAPLSPHLAARRAGTTIQIPRIVKWIHNTLHDMQVTVQWQVIETAGGVFTPLSDTASNFDLALALAPARWILVVPDRLGALHDAMASFTAMTARGGKPDALVVNPTGLPDASTGTNADELRRLLHPTPVYESTLGASDRVNLGRLLELLHAPGTLS